MRFLKWLNRWFGKTDSSPNILFNRYREDRHTDLELIRLEDRIVLNVSAALGGTSGDVLQLNLTAANDEATVSVVDNGATIQVDDGLGLPNSILQFDATQVSSILVTGVDPAQTLQFLGQQELVLNGPLDLTGFSGDVNIGIELQIGLGEPPQFNPASTVTYLGQFELSGDHLDVILPNELNADDAFVIQIIGPNLEILDPDQANPLLFTAPIAGLDSINVIGADGETDLLTLNYGSPGLTDIAITFEGGAGGNDALEILNGTFDTVTHNLTGVGSGSIDVSGNGITEISYSGLEPVFSGTSTANQVVINLPAGTTEALLENATNAGEMQIRSLSAAFEFTTFAAPATSLTINTAGGNSIVMLDSFDATFAPDTLRLNGSAGDTFQLTSSDLLADSVSLTLAGGATLDLGAFNETVDGFLLEDGTVIVTSGVLTAQSDVELRSGSVNASLNGSNLIKNGNGTAVLTGTNSFTGTTSVQSGSLTIEGSLSSTEVFVSSGATLGGSGTIDGPVTVNAGGVLAPGSSPGIVSTGDLTFSAGSTLEIEVDGTVAGTEYDQVQVTGTVDLNGATLNLISTFTAAAGDEFLLIDNDGVDAITGAFAGLAEGTLFTFNGNQVFITYQGGDGNDVALTVNTAPVVGNQVFDVDENTANTTSIGNIIAADTDLPADSLSFSVTGGSGQGIFSVSPAGEITVQDQSQLDYEMATSFDLDITVTDSAGATDTATITVNLNPVNDNSPVISDLVREVDENATNGTLVGSVLSATDADQPGDTLTFSETGGTGTAAFDITSTGQIVVADQSLLNFETNPSYTLEILVDDNAGSTTAATITINLNDLVETLVIDTGDWSATDITIIRNGSQLHVVETGTMNEIVPAHEFSNVSSIVITGNGLDNTVRLDHTGGSFIPAGGISFDGNGGGNTLIAADQMNDWLIDGTNAGSLLSGSITFQNVQNLTGGSQADTFTVTGVQSLNLLGGAGDDLFLFSDNASAIAGLIDGQEGVDHLNLSNYTTSLSVDLTGLGSSDGFDGSESTHILAFSNIDQLTGGSASNSLTGINSAAVWTLDGTNTYQSTNSIEFSKFTNLTGGSDVDVFNFTPDSESFLIDGGFPTALAIGDVINIDTSVAGTGTVAHNFDGTGTISTALASVSYSDVEKYSLSGTGDIELTGTSGDDTIEIIAVGPTIEYRLGGTLIGVSTLSDTNSITVNAGDGNDSLTIDSALAAEGITVDYDGQGNVTTNPGDVLNLLGTATSVEYFFNNSSSGSIRIDGTLSDFINYTGLEPVTSTINAVDITLNYSNVAETISISSSGVGETTITSTAGETLTFLNPSGTVTINTGDGSDLIELNSLTADFTASLIINGEGDTDTLNINNSNSLVTGKNLEFNVETINIANGIVLSATGIALNATEVNLDGDLDSSNVSGDATSVNVLGSAGGADMQDAVDVAGNGAVINVATGSYLTSGTLEIDESVSILGAGRDVVEIRKAGAPGGNFDVAVNVSASDVTISGARLGWEIHTSATDYQGYIVTTTADNTTLNNLLFSDNYRSAVVFEGADNLEVSNSIFEGKFGRAAIRDGDGGSGENFLITRNEFRADHFRWGPIAIGPQGTFGDPNNFAFSGVISYNYFGNGVEAGTFQEAGDQNYTVTITNSGMTADGLDIVHNTFDWQDSNTTNSNGIYAQPGGVYFDPSLSVPVGSVNITDNIFNGFSYAGPQPTTDPLWNPTGGVFGGALEFDGVDDFGLFSDPSFDVGESGTLSFWVNMDDTGRRNQFFEGPDNGGLEFQYRTNGGGQFYGRTLGSSDFTIQQGGQSGVAGMWTNIQYTWDASSGEMHIYINGVEQPYLSAFDENLSGFDNSHFTDTVNGLMNVGRDPGDNSRFFDGLMDDVGWFDEVLNQTDRDTIRVSGVSTLSADARLVAHWDFDQATGNIAVDNTNGIQMFLSTNGIVPFGPEFQETAGQFGGALEFDGIDDFATFQDPGFDVGRQGTLNFWVNMDDTGRRNQFFEGPENGGLEFQYRTNGGGQFYGRTQDGADFTIQQGGQSGVAGMWTNIQYTWDADIGEMHIYIDGDEEPYLSSFDENLAGFDSTHFTNTINGLMNVGRDPADPARYFDGLMDDIGWFNEVLTESERTEIMTNGVAAMSGDSRLVAHWDLDDAAGTTIVSGDSGTNITLYIQAEPPLPPIQGFGVIAPLNANVTYNAFNGNDLDSNLTLDSTNVFGDPLFAYSNDPLYVAIDSLEEQFTIGFGSSAAYTSSEFASDSNTTTPHIGAYQNPPTVYPGLYGTGDIVIFGTGEDDLLELTLTGEDTATFVLTRDVNGLNETILGTVLITDITSITFNGLGGDDVLIINQPDGQFFNAENGIIFNGGSQNNNGNALGIVGIEGDTLVINHTNPLEADSVAYAFTPDLVPADGEDGKITISDASISDGSTTITFTGLEPIIDNLLVANRDFDFTDADETISLSDDGVIGDGYSFIDSTLSESVLFLDPTSSLTIRTDSAGTDPGVDTVLVNSLDSTFTTSLTILAGSDDSVTFESTTTLLTGDLFVTAETVDIEADIFAASVEISSSGSTSTTLNGGTVTTTNSQLYHDAVNFVTDSTLTSVLGDNIEFASTVDGAINLNIDTAGTTIFGDEVGTSLALTSLTTNTGGTTQINCGSITTTGDLVFHDNVTLGADAILTSTMSGLITFNQTLNGAFALELNTASITTFNGTVGNIQALASLETDSGGATYINAGTINTTSSQIFNDSVQLLSDTILNSLANDAITFISTLNGTFTLEVNTEGITTFNNQIGNTAALVSLTTDAGGSTQINGGSIVTSENQTFNDAVVVSASTSFTATTAGDISFNSTLIGGTGLSINIDASNDVSFHDAVSTNGDVTVVTGVDFQSTGAGIDTTTGGTAGGNIKISANTGQADFSDGILLTGDGGSISVNAGTGLNSLNTSYDTTTGTGGGNVELIVSAGNLSLTSGNVAVNGAGTVLLTAKGAAADILLSSEITSGNGSITILADNDISLTSTAKILSTSNGAITLTADNDGSSAGQISMASGSSVESQGGMVSLSAYDDIEVAAITTSGGRVDLTSTIGSITDNDLTSAQNVTANQLVINANMGIGESTDALDTSVSFLEADAGQLGLFLDNIGNLTVGDITAQVGLSANEEILVNVTGTLDIIENVQSATGDITFNATDELTVDLSTTVSTLSAGAILLTSTRNIKLNKGSNLKAENGSITLLANTGGLTIGDFIGIEADNTTIETTGTGEIILRGIGGNDGSTSSHHGVLLHSATTIATTAGNITINGTAGTASGTSDGVLVEGALTTVSSVDGNVNINGTAAIDNGIVITDEAIVSASGLGNIELNGESTGTGSGILLASTIKNTMGTITLISEDDILLASLALIDSTSGTVTLTADNAGGSNGAPITMIDGAFINAGTGDINLTADGNILLGGLLTTGTVTVDSQSASILDNGVSHTDIQSSSAVLMAATGIGTGNPLETIVSTISATVSSSGGIFIDNTGAVELLNFTTFDGEIIVNATGTITATSVVSSNNSASDDNDITLTATGSASDIEVTTVSALGNADVSLSADDGIMDTNGGDANRITSDNLTLTSNSANGTLDGIDVDTDVNSLTANVNNNAGGIIIDEVVGIALTQIGTFDGFITVNAAGTIEAIDVVSFNNTGHDTQNGIALSASGVDSDIIITTLSALNAADTSLFTERDILDSGSADSNIIFADELTAIAGRNIGGISDSFTQSDFDPLQTTVNLLDLASGNIIAIHNTGTSPILKNLDAGTLTAGITFVQATGGSLDTSLTTGIHNFNDTIGFVSDTSITVRDGFQTGNLSLRAPDIIDEFGGNVDIKAVDAILFDSMSAETIEITAQRFDGIATGTIFSITNDSPALELVDLNADTFSLTGGTNTDISLSSVGSVTVTDLVQVLGTGTLSLETTGTSADLVFNHNIQSETGSVTIEIANDILMNGTSRLTSISGAVSLTADADKITGGGITMTDGTLLDAGDDTVTLIATDDITIGQIITTNATSTAILIDTDSSLIDAGDTAGEDLIANSSGARVTIIADLGAGKVGDLNGEIETQIDELNITNQTGGEIRIMETDDLHIFDLLQSTAGDIFIISGGNIALNGLIETAADHVMLDALGSITDQNDNVPGQVNVNANSLDLNAVTGIGLGDTLELTVNLFSADSTNGDVLIHNTADTSVTATSITTGTGNIELSQAGNEALTIDLSSTLDGTITISNEGDSHDDTLELTSVSAGGATPEINVTTVYFGNILLGDLSALDGVIAIISAGEINDAFDDQMSPEIDLNAASGSITLQAVNGIGNNHRVELASGSLSIDTNTGNIALSNTSSDATGAVNVLQITTSSGTIGYTQTGGQETTFEEVTTTASAIAVQTDGSILFENTGGLTDVVSTDGAGTIQVSASGLNSSIEINDGFRTSGGTIDITAQNSLIFGSDGDLNSSDGDISLLADSASMGTGGGGITMSDGTVFDAGSGLLDLQAADNINIGQLSTTAMTRVTSTDGGVIDAGDTGGRDITANQLVIRSSAGAGSEDALETAVSLIAALNTDTGSIQIHNDLGGALLTIGSVDGIDGITNAAGVAGDIVITNASPLTVDAEVTNSSGGNINLASTGPGDLILNASVRAFGGNGNINVEAGDGILDINDTGAASDHSVAGSGIFSGHGASGVLIDTNATLTSETGAVAGVPPLLQNILTPQISATGEAMVSGDFGRFSEQNFFITIDWGDGTIETFNFTDPGSFVFEHTYTANPNIQNPAADIPILVTMQGDLQFTFSDNSGSLDLTSEAGLLETPGEGLANVAIDTTPQVPQLIFPETEVILDATSNQQSVFTTKDTLTIDSAILEANKNVERLIFLRILAPNGSVIEDVPLDESDLDNLPKLFKTLPDGRYQIYLKEAGEERIRLLMDVDIRNGKASDVTEEQSNPSSTQEMQNSSGQEDTTQLKQSDEKQTLYTIIETVNGFLDLVDGSGPANDLMIQTPEVSNPYLEEHSDLKPDSQTTARLEQAWSSAALLSGVFRGKSLLKKPTTTAEHERAMEQYGGRLLNRRYQIPRRNDEP